PVTKDGPGSNSRTTPVNFSLNSSSVTVRGPTAGSLRWTLSPETPSTTRKWLNPQNTITGNVPASTVSTSRRQPFAVRPYACAAWMTLAALLPSRETPQLTLSSLSGTCRPNQPSTMPSEAAPH